METSDKTTNVKVLVKPPGEAGAGSKRGYNLRHAMELRGREGKKLYNEILVRELTVSAVKYFSLVFSLAATSLTDLIFSHTGICQEVRRSSWP